MTRVLALTLIVLVLLLALTTYIVFRQRRSFPANEQMIFGVSSGNSQESDIFGVYPSSSFGENYSSLFYPDSFFNTSFITGVDCSHDSHSLIFWNGFLYRYDLASHSLTQLIAGDGIQQASAWSSDGTRIAYIDRLPLSNRYEIFSIHVDGTNKSQLTNNHDQETALSWSPDDRYIAYTYFNSNVPSQQRIATVEVANGAETTIYNAAGTVNDVAWSPDGTRIAFDMSKRGRTDIYTVKPDGSALTRLTSASWQNILPRWSPDGSMISYSARDVDGYYQLYVMNADGSAPYLVVWNRVSSSRNMFNRCWTARMP